MYSKRQLNLHNPQMLERKRNGNNQIHMSFLYAVKKSDQLKKKYIRKEEEDEEEEEEVEEE